MGEGETAPADHGIPVECARTVPAWVVAIDNVPTAIMFILGAALLWLVWWPYAIIFLLYCGLSIVLFWRLICPYCHHYDTRACPCGYGVIAARFFERGDGPEFRRVFRQRLGVMFPAWIVPFMAGLYLLSSDFSQFTLGLLLTFCIVGFLIIPAISKFVGCKGCEIKDQCPWMT
jgi:hypothetical protein